jgi:putative transposase
VNNPVRQEGSDPSWRTVSTKPQRSYTHARVDCPYAHRVARSRRIRSGDHMDHVTARGIARRPIYRTDDDRWEFLRALSDTVAERTWRCHAYCLMDNHYHLLVDTPNADLPEGMRDLNSAYATRFNGRHATTGHVFQGRYDARLVRSDAHALEVARYIPLNPVRAGLCIMPESWLWSSYRAMAGLIRAPTFLDVTTTVGWRA